MSAIDDKPRIGRDAGRSFPLKTTHETCRLKHIAIDGGEIGVFEQGAGAEAFVPQRLEGLRGDRVAASRRAANMTKLQPNTVPINTFILKSQNTTRLSDLLLGGEAALCLVRLIR